MARLTQIAALLAAVLVILSTAAHARLLSPALHRRLNLEAGAGPAIQQVLSLHRHTNDDDNIAEESTTVVSSDFLGDPSISSVTRWILELLRETSQRIAVGDYEKAGKKLFSPRAIAMPPDAPSTFLYSTYQKAAFMQQLATSLLPNVQFQPEGISIYDLKYKTYKKYGMTIVGSYVTAPSPYSPQPAGPADNGKFVFYWDLLKDSGGNGDISGVNAEAGAGAGAGEGKPVVARFPLEGNEGEMALRAATTGGVDVGANSEYIWGLSWMIWNSDLPRTPPHTGPFLAADSAAQDAAAEAESSAGASIDDADEEQQANAVATVATVPAAAAVGDPRPADVIMGIQMAWQSFAAAIAAGDVATAARVYAPIVTLLPPNAARIVMTTPDQKAAHLQKLVDAKVSFQVTVEDVQLVNLKATTDPSTAGSASGYSALVRSVHTASDAKGRVISMGKQVDLWVSSPYFPPGQSQWTLALSMWNRDGAAELAASDVDADDVAAEVSTAN
eukprot:TRINITY_DN6279_c0_g1_i2.p1 TRINITY_DN6279_c0_g1~~TRINITY_DN6279_c0_g1_i2.p1  ORF type:complete len:502 (+),score=9.76 TRINITY_DN6279_c0_g1_i2:88-1593(+)